MAPPDDRAAVLRRRALFLGSALTALASCEKGGVPPETSKGPVVAVPEGVPEDAGPEPDAGSLPVTDGGRKPKAGMPSLEIPDGLSERAKSNYEHLVARMKTVHAILDDVEAGAPKCGIAGCEDRWQPIAKKWFDLDDAFRFSYVCPGSSEQAKAFGVRRQEHMDFYQARRKEVQDWLQQKLGDAGWTRFEELVQKEQLANPRPCLSFACMDW